MRSILSFQTLIFGHFFIKNKAMNNSNQGLSQNIEKQFRNQI